MESGAVDRATKQWHWNVGSPYTIAYNDAYDSFQKALKQAEDNRRARAELFIALASVMSTSVLMGVAAYGPFRRLAMRSALRTIGSQNLRAVIGLFATGEHPILSFAFGQAFGLVKGKAGDKVKSIASDLLVNTGAGITSLSPVSRGEEVHQMIGLQGLAIENWVVELHRDRTVPDSLRSQAMAALERAPFLQPPRFAIHPDVLKPRIELGFYMQFILNTDYTVSHGPVGSRLPQTRGPGIAALPSDRKNYPRSEPASGMSYYTTVEIDRPDWAIQEATDAAHQQVYGRPFYTVGRHLGFWQSPSGKAEELIRAEQVLRDLSTRTRPTEVGALKLV